jgi:anti-sigma factor RsiW
MTLADEQNPAPVIDATTEALAARLAALEEQNAKLAELVQGRGAQEAEAERIADLEKRVKSLEGIVAKSLSAPKGKAGAGDTGALSKLGHAVYRLQEHALPVEKDDSLLDL